MRIDLNIDSHAEISRDSAQATSRKTTGTSASIVPGQQAVDSKAGPSSRETLAAHLEAVPDVRSQRVQALRNLIQAGAYPIAPQKIADAMLSDTVGAKS